MKRLFVLFIICFVFLIGLVGCKSTADRTEDKVLYTVSAGSIVVHSDAGFYVNGYKSSNEMQFSLGVLTVYENYIIVYSTSSTSSGIQYHLSKEGTSWAAYNITYEFSYHQSE